MAVKHEEQTSMSETRTYSVVLRPEPEGGFTVLVPLFPEIVSYGDDEREALEMAKEAIELAIEHRASLGEDIPDTQSIPVREVTVLVPAA
jgi:antitoxin HicB